MPEPEPPSTPPPQYPLGGGPRYTDVNDFYRMVGIGAVVVIAGIALLIYGERRGVSYDGVYDDTAGGGVPGGVAVAPETDGGGATLWVDGLGAVGAAVLIDGDSVGAVPLWTHPVSEGERRVQVVGPNETTVLDTTLRIEPGAFAELDLDALVPEAATSARLDVLPAPLEPSAPAARAPQAATGALRVTSSPSGAAVSVDGRRTGATPLSLGGLRPGRYSVSVALDGYETMVREVDLQAGGQVETAIALRPRSDSPQSPSAPSAATTSPTGTVEILVRPWGRIDIDGETHRQETDVVYRAALAPGTHRVRVTHPRLGSDERAVTVRPGGRTRVEFDLTGGDDG